jgi:16S rRNA (guanine527-N7)-methyltransferase
VFHVERDALLEAYLDLVRRWAPKLDLVSPSDLPRFRERHIEDALRAAPLLADLPDGPCVDVGSGVGIPGVPLAVADPARPWTFLEPRGRRAAFLEEVVRALGLGCRILQKTAQEATAAGETFAVGTARALAPPEVASRLLLPLLRPDGAGLLWIGRRAEAPPGAEVSEPGLAIIRRDHLSTESPDDGRPEFQ